MTSSNPTSAKPRKTGSQEKPLAYSDMQAQTGFTITYTPHEDSSIELKAIGNGPDIIATFSHKRMDEAHILYMESMELLRSRAKIHQTQDEIRRAEETLFAMFRGEKVSLEQIASVSAPRPAFVGSAPLNKPIDVDGIRYDRLLVKTRLIALADKDLLPIIMEYAGPHIQPGDILFISEKALSITQQKVIDLSDIKPSWFAYLFARNVANHYGTSDFHGFGHGTPLAMQLLIEEAGYPRAIFAAAVSAVTRPLKIRGLFYALCGTRAKSVDLPMSFLILEYAHSAKLAPDDSTGFAKRVKARLGCEVAILDSNYRGAFSLGKTSSSITESFIDKLFEGNPMGQSDEMTPFCIVRKA
jgi:F420-0:gamma-glutamyl ligase